MENILRDAKNGVPMDPSLKQVGYAMSTLCDLYIVYWSGGHVGLKGLNCGGSQVPVLTLHIHVE